MMIEMHKPVVPGQAFFMSARVVPYPNKAPAGPAAGCLVNVVGSIFISSPPPKLVVAATTPISIPIPIQRRRRLMATSNANADMANNDNNIWPCIPSSSYGDPCLDLFFNALRPEYRDSNPCLKHVEQLLHLAWSHDPLTTLKLVFTFDSISFSDRKFDTAVLWLYHNHPKTLLRNLHSIADLPLVPYPRHGSWYNLCQILYNVLVKKRDGQNHHDVAAHLLRLHPERYDRDPDYRLLHDRVIDVFVKRLKSDIDKMNSHLLVSGAAECCTSTQVWDKHRADAIFLLESIARRVSPPESDESGEEFLVPLTNYYKRQQEQCRVKKYLKKVKAAAAAVGGGGNLSGGIDIIKPDALLPNEIIIYVKYEDVREAAELQWKAMVDLYLKQQQQGEGLGKFKNWLVVGRYPREFWEVGLRLLVSELSEEPWKGKLIGGEDEPDWIQGDHDLKSKYELALKSECSVLGAIDLILEVGVNMNLKVEQMIKKVIVFTELQPPDTTTWEIQYELLWSEFEAIQSKFKDKGYGDDVVPHILYWHVSTDEEDSWICTQHSGFTLLSGGSDNLIKSFLHNGGEIGPHHLMEAAIAYKEYQTFVVVD